MPYSVTPGQRIDWLKHSYCVYPYNVEQNYEVELFTFEIVEQADEVELFTFEVYEYVEFQ